MQNFSEEEASQMGLRFKSARSLIKLSRKEFCEKHELNRHTLQSWEIGRNVSRPQKLKTFCEALANEGVFCTPQWLTSGKGVPPTKLKTMSPLFLNGASGADQEKLIVAEANYFRKNLKKQKVEPIVVKVADDAMLPHYAPGDYVGGEVLKGDYLDSIVGEACIVETAPKSFIVRNLMKESDRYLLVPSDLSQSIVSLQEIKSVAKVIWWRKVPQSARYGYEN